MGVGGLEDDCAPSLVRLAFSLMVLFALSSFAHAGSCTGPVYSGGSHRPHAAPTGRVLPAPDGPVTGV